ncbi:hypothetical protein BT96DRAFT_201421 [Gymnopus androsaceus JB14]|uniref:Uncharacterized protein n=1 Tax=Gymnopus androsaceus JB14 TaxID=1447944 RepID=A0A6A4H7D3_9AGAR|nr:hypothetical protein BT96DRAFT_201421 [Gymnopus androsaceus JB14]
MSSQHDADILIQTHLQVPTSRNGLHQGHDILAIPQLEACNSESEANFARGYGPALLEVGLTQQVMSTFIDGLNLAMSASPPLHVVGAAGSILGYVYVYSIFYLKAIQLIHVYIKARTTGQASQKHQSKLTTITKPTPAPLLSQSHLQSTTSDMPTPIYSNTEGLQPVCVLHPLSSSFSALHKSPTTQ